MYQTYHDIISLSCNTLFIFGGLQFIGVVSHTTNLTQDYRAWESTYRAGHLYPRALTGLQKRKSPGV